MLAELSILPQGRDSHTADELAGVLKLIADSGLPYQLTPSATCIEGRWHEIMPLIERCHAYVRQHCDHVVTLIKLEDDAGAHDKLVANLQSVEQKAGRPLRTAPLPSA